MAKDTEITANTENFRNPDGTFAKGNPGKPKGAISFATKWEIFIEKVAKQNGLTPNEIDEQLLAVGFKKAKEGDYNFYRDVHDRLYGRATQPIDHTTQGEKIEANPELVAIAKRFEEELKGKL